MKKFQQYQSGNAILIIVVLVAVAAIAGGFFLMKQGVPLSIPGISQLTPRATEKDFEFITDANLRKHFVAQTNQTTYRTTSLSSGAGLTFISEVQIVGENFNHRETRKDGNKDIFDTITLGDTIYVKDYTDGKWWKQTLKPEPTSNTEQEEAPTKPVDLKEEYSKDTTKYTFIGKEPCGNLTCFKYEATYQDEGGGKRTFWFDDKKYLLRKERSGFGEFSVDIEYSYDGINVRPPTPTKDVPEGKSIYDYYFGTPDTTTVPSQEELNKLQKQYGIPQNLNPESFPSLPQSEDIGY